MSQSQTLVTAGQVRELLLAHLRVDDKLAQLSAVAPADPQATHTLVAGLAGGQWKIVLGCARALGQAGEDCAEIAVEGLLKCLIHPYPDVRADTANSLLALSALVEVDLEPLWEAMLGEEEPRSYLALGSVILNCLRSGAPAPPHWGPKLAGFLQQILDLQLTQLPLSGVIPQRHTLSLETPETSAGLMDRLLGRKQPQQLVWRSDPAPRPVYPENRRFLADEGDRVRDAPGVISQLVTIYAYVPVEPKARLNLLLELVQMPLSSFATSETLVVEAAKLVRDTPGKMALLASMWGWGRSYEPTWAGRLALAAAQARPDLRLPLLQFLRARQSHIDWAGWANSLRDVSPIDLEPIVAATLAAPESELGGWMRLLSQAPVVHIIAALARALAADDKQVASEALERLLQYGEPVPWLLNDIHRLREKWAKEPAMLNNLNALMKTAVAVPAPSPSGMREPDLVVEWSLEEGADNPFAPSPELSWQEGLGLLEAFTTPGGPIHLITSSLLVRLAPGTAPMLRSLPSEAVGKGLSLLAIGHNGDLLFVAGDEGARRLYLLEDGAAEFQPIEPPLSRDQAPEPGDLYSDGTTYGWVKRQDLKLCIDRQRWSLESSWPANMQPLAVDKITTRDIFLPPLGFGFSSCGSYRVCESERLAIHTGLENPVHSQGRADGRLALHLEVFPSRLHRIYLWRR